jgi:hypothetical protein
VANLSAREAQRAMSMLRRYSLAESAATGIMLDVQLELAMQHDALAACCLIMQQLSSVQHVSLGPATDETKSTGTGALQTHLEDNPELLSRTLDFLCDQLESHADKPGRLCLALTAYGRVLTRASMHPMIQDATKKQEVPTWIRRALAALQIVLGNESSAASPVINGVRADRLSDRANDLLVVALSLTTGVLLSMAASSAVEQYVQMAANGFQAVWRFRNDSGPTTQKLFACLALAFQFSDAKAIYCAIERCLSSCDGPSEYKSFTGTLSASLETLCQWALSHNILDCSSLESELCNREKLLDATLIVQLFRCEQTSSRKKSEIAKALQSLVLADEAANEQFLSSSSSAVAGIEAACRHLQNEPGPKVPLLLPIHMETFAMDATVRRQSLFFVQLLYAFIFLEHNPDSPFAFDPRMLPLRQIYHFIAKKPLSKVYESVSSRVKSFIERFCPETPHWHRSMNAKSRHWTPATMAMLQATKGTRMELLKFMRKCMCDLSFDPCGLKSERAFIIASVHLCDADLLSATVSAMISQPVAPPLFLTYPMLCRDPLVILKCPLNIWSRTGTRRIALFILTRLLEVNELIVRESAQNDEVVDEYLCSRNELVVRSLLSVLLFPERLESPSCRCGFAVGMIRKTIASQRGLVGMLIKQSVREAEFDWMTEFVPELIDDSVPLRSILSDGSSLSAAERLVAADCILRISLCQGYRHVDDAEALVVAALAQLVSSFFLIVGPVGIPVNALVSGGGGLDATQVSRKAAFRMLKALEKVRGQRARLKNEIVVSLQKFAGMCKGEYIVGSLPSAIANRQKTLLKDLSESTGKALDCLGCYRHVKM